jgi:hypothetical protein
MKHLIVTILLQAIFLFNNLLVAQAVNPYSFGKVSVADFAVQSEKTDTGASAVILYDKGLVNFTGNNKGWFTMVYNHSRRVLIKKAAGFSFATVDVWLYKNKIDKEYLDNVSATAYTLDNGDIIKTKLNLKEIYEEKYDKNYFIKKFTIPGVKEGSIIEYTYEVKSEFLFNLPEWHFQHVGAPVLWSEYIVTFPELFVYLSSEKSFYPYYINEAKEGYQHYSIKRQRTTSDGAGYASTGEQMFSLSATTVERRWVKKQVPAFVFENHIASPFNLLDGISFQLIKTFDGESFYDYANTWRKVADDLSQRDDFGAMLNRRNDWLDKVLQHEVDSKDDKLTSAKKIYNYVQRQYTCTGDDFLIKNSLQEVVKNKAGNAGEINLLLAALLQTRGITVHPVVLSTREYMRNSATYPFLRKLNYKICRAVIDGNIYLLDAAEPYLPFGKLHYKCYNGHARVISKDTAALYLYPDEITDEQLVKVNIRNSDKGLAQGRFEETMGFYESLDFKKYILKTGEEQFKNKLAADSRDEFEISKILLHGMAGNDSVVKTTFDFTLPQFGEANMVYFNPILWKAIKYNPFPAVERRYPVELPYKTNRLYTLTMEIPAGYAIDELPKDFTTKLNESEGIFEYNIKTNGNLLEVNANIQISYANFDKEEYSNLRDFYALIINKFTVPIVFKKIK